MISHDVSAFNQGRPLQTLEAPFSGQDCSYANQRLDNQEMSSAAFYHVTFNNMSFKKTKLSNGIFENCVFLSCYFRRADFSNCRFIGCRFFDCNFSHVSLRGCNFRFSNFKECQISFGEMEQSLPTEPNIKEHLARNLSVESSALGLMKEARRYRLAEINAHEQHLSAAIRCESQWYKEHYGNFDRVKAAVSWFGSLMNRWLWGYGERAWVLVRNWLLLTFIVFPFIYYLNSGTLKHVDNRPLKLGDYIYFSLENMLPGGFSSGVEAFSASDRLLAGLESLFGVVATALFAAYVFRWSLHR